jgi:acyl-CoA synthetase (AMP-forming)/AMP-acid ligase II
LQPGDRVGMLGLNSDRYVEYLYGVWCAGGVINPVNIRWNPKVVAYSLDDCDTRILLVDDTFIHMAGELKSLSRSLHTLVQRTGRRRTVSWLRGAACRRYAGRRCDAQRQRS